MFDMTPNYPTPTYDFRDFDGDGIMDAGRYVWDGTTHDRNYNFGLKVDHIFNEKNRIALRFLYNDWNQFWDSSQDSRYSTPWDFLLPYWILT